MTRYVLYPGIIVVMLVLWALIRPRKKMIPPKTEPVLPNASVKMPLTEGHAETNPKLPRVTINRRLKGEPIVFGLEDLRLEIRVSIANDRTEIIDELERCGALDGSWNDEEKFLSLYAAPAELIHRAYPEALETLKLLVNLVDSHKISVARAYGVFSEVKRELKEFLNPAPNWDWGIQERGDFVAGKYFTADSFVYADDMQDDKPIRIAVISRERLGEAMDAELDRLRHFLSRPS